MRQYGCKINDRSWTRCADLSSQIDLSWRCCPLLPSCCGNQVLSLSLALHTYSAAFFAGMASCNNVGKILQQCDIMLPLMAMLVYCHSEHADLVSSSSSITWVGPTHQLWCEHNSGPPCWKESLQCWLAG